jgi:hypothetical protein
LDRHGGTPLGSSENKFEFDLVMKSIGEREIVAQMGLRLFKAATFGAEYMGIAACTAPKFSYPYLSAVTGKTLEAISKRPLELNIRVGPKRPILEIRNGCLRLAVSSRLDLESD